MNIIIKKIALVFCTAALSLSSTVALADFADMPTDDTRAALENAVKNGLLTGYEDNTVRPYDNITRAQMGAIIVRAFGATGKADLSAFSDMNNSQWFYDAMSSAVYMEAFQGDGSNLNPESFITYQEAFAVLARVFDLQTKQDVDKLKLKYKVIDALPDYSVTALDEFSDNAGIADWARNTTLSVVEGGYFNPADKLLRSGEYINRTQFAILMDNLVKTYINEAGTYNSLPEGNIMVRADNVIIDGVKGEADIFVGDSVKEGVSVTNADLDRLIIRNGNVKATGTFNQIRLLGHNCRVDISDGYKIIIEGYAKYNDSSFYLGVKELGK